MLLMAYRQSKNRYRHSVESQSHQCYFKHIEKSNGHIAKTKHPVERVPAAYHYICARILLLSSPIASFDKSLRLLDSTENARASSETSYTKVADTAL